MPNLVCGERVRVGRGVYPYAVGAQVHLAVSGCLCPGPGLSVGVVRGLFAARPRYLLGVFATGSVGGEVYSASHAPSHNHAWLRAIPHARCLTEHTQLLCGGCVCRVRVYCWSSLSRGDVWLDRALPHHFPRNFRHRFLESNHLVRSS